MSKPIDPAETFLLALKSLYKAANSPKLSILEQNGLPTSTVSNWLNGQTVPGDEQKFVLLVRLLKLRAKEGGVTTPTEAQLRRLRTQAWEFTHPSAGSDSRQKSRAPIDKVDQLGLGLPLSEPVKDLVDPMSLGPISSDGHRTLRGLLDGQYLENPDWAYRHAVDEELLPDMPDMPDRTQAYAVARYIGEELFLDDEGRAVKAALARLCLRIADETSDQLLARSLRAWVSRYCGKPITRPQRKPAFQVSVQVSRSGAGANSMLLNVVVQPSDGSANYVASEPVASSRVQSRVQELLPRVIDNYVPPGSSLIVEFVLPRAWLSKPVDEWTLGRHGLVRLGWRHPVVVRDFARVRDRELSQRWVTMAHSGADAVHWVSCRDVTTVQQIAASLALHSGRAVLALANPPILIGRSPILRVGFDSGIPAILWRRVVCTEHSDEHSCPGQRFETDVNAELDAFLTLSPIRDLPELVRRLRASAGQIPVGEPHCGRALTLLWDPPERPAPPVRLAIAN